MDAADLAKEVCTYNKLRDRPSHLTLFLTSGGMMITSPIENGRQRFHLSGSGIEVNYDPDNTEALAMIVDAIIIVETESSLELRSMRNFRSLLASWRADYFLKECDYHSRLRKIQVVLKTLLIADMPQ